MAAKMLFFLAIGLLVGCVALTDEARPTGSEETPLIWPIPKQMEQKGLCSLPEPFYIQADNAFQGAKSLLEEEMKAAFGFDSVQKRGKTLIYLSVDKKNFPEEDSYHLSIEPAQVVIRAGSPQGAFWGVQSFLQVLKSSKVQRHNEGWLVPQVRVTERDITAFRSFMIQGAWAPHRNAFKDFLRLLAFFKVRYFALEFGPQVVLSFDPSIARGERWSIDEARDVINYGRKLGLEPIGYLNLLAHLERAYEKKEFCEGGGIRIYDPAVYDRFIFPILEEMLKVYGEIKWFHCGMDEANELFHHLQGKGFDGAVLLANHIQRIRDFLSKKQKGIRLVIWHDMLFSPDLSGILGGVVGPANGGPPYNTWRALDMIPKDVIINYWFYDPQDRYPAIDWLKKKGFEVWASPWQLPFSLVRYAMERKVPTMGTLWADPPMCFATPSFAPVPALYAQAVWNPVVAVQTKEPESSLRDLAIKKTVELLWSRPTLTFSARQAILFHPASQKSRILTYPSDWEKAPEQFSGVPFDFSDPLLKEPVDGEFVAVTDYSQVALVQSEDGRSVRPDGVNRMRGGDELIIYSGPLKTTGTNIYGAEAAVSPEGVVLEVAGYGHGNMPIPAGGFVLSAHAGPQGDKYEFVSRLKKGDRLALYDASGRWLGGWGLTRLAVQLPDRTQLPIDGWDQDRGEDALILYQAGYGEGFTRTNQWGVEVVVRNDTVVEVQDGRGNAAIPDDGFVLSAHYGFPGEKAKRLSALRIGDRVALILIKGRKQFPLEELVKTRSWQAVLNSPVTTLFIAISSERRAAIGQSFGTLIVEYADKTTVKVPLRFGYEVGTEEEGVLPLPKRPEVWCLYRTGSSSPVLILEWQNPKPTV
ncbi:MAG: beta-N-acetylhexosaminidase, partial [Armatimonadetes bacterium]|nr:beta-N-acetylhexosaminidase [Armatimonadota bacterium]